MTDQQATIASLVRHVHGELLDAVRTDITRREGRKPDGTTLAELTDDRPWLLGDDNYHIDVTHLAATIQFARQLDDPQSLHLVFDLCRYGRRLSARLQLADDEPIAELCAAYALFFGALLGQQVDEAVAYFRQRAHEEAVDAQRLATGQMYWRLLIRLGNHREAFQAAAALCRESGDLVGYANALLQADLRVDDSGPQR